MPLEPGLDDKSRFGLIEALGVIFPDSARVFRLAGGFTYSEREVLLSDRAGPSKSVCRTLTLSDVTSVQLVMVINVSTKRDPMIPSRPACDVSRRKPLNDEGKSRSADGADDGRSELEEDAEMVRWRYPGLAINGPLLVGRPLEPGDNPVPMTVDVLALDIVLLRGVDSTECTESPTPVSRSR